MSGSRPLLNFDVDSRVDVVAAFLSCIEFNRVQECNKCVFSEWYASDIADYWSTRRTLRSIMTLDTESANNTILSPEIRSAVKKIIPSDLLETRKEPYKSNKGASLKILVNDQQTWNKGLRISLALEEDSSNMGVFFALKNKISEFFLDQKRKIQTKQDSEHAQCISERTRSSKSKSVPSSSGSSKSTPEYKMLP